MKIADAPPQVTTDGSDIVIAGGGFVGLTAAAALAAGGAHVTVFEGHPGPNPAFRGELIHPRGVRAMATLGLVDPLLQAGAVRVRGFAVFAPHCVDAIVLPYPEESGGGLALDHAELVEALHAEVAARPRVRVVRGARVTEPLCDQGRVVGVRLEGGAEHRAALVVVADGRHSRLRRLVGVPTETRLLSHSAALAIRGDVLAEPHHGHVFVDAPGPTLAYPCGEGRVRMCIDVPLAAAKGQDRLRGYLREHYLPKVPDPLRRAMAESLATSPLAGAANHAIVTRACAVRGLALVGDAGGCSHPITAAGMTNGMNDVVLLAASVSRYGLTDDALRAYQRQRYRFVRTREAFSGALYDVLLGAEPGTLALRDGLFAYWRSTARARRASMAVLCGEDERVGSFTAEYLRVVGASSAVCLTEGLAEQGVLPTLSGLRALFGAAGGAMRDAVEKAASTVALGWTTRLASAPIADRDPNQGVRARRSGGIDEDAPHSRVTANRRDSVEEA